jgi:hypothetical protein
VLPVRVNATTTCLALLGGLLLCPTGALAVKVDTFAATLTEVDPDGQASRIDNDSSHTASAESYSEAPGVVGGKWFASALAEHDGNLEVGVDNDLPTFLRGTSFADATLFLTHRYTSGPRISAVEFTIQPGEILFTTPRKETAPAVGTHAASLSALLTATINNVDVAQYRFSLRLISTNGGFDIDPASSGTALVHIDHVFSGDGGVWGLTTAAFTDVLLLPPLEPHDLLQITYEMRAKGEVHGYNDIGIGVSAKIGDPLDLQGGGILNVPPDPVPEPATSCLLAVGFLAMVAAHVRRRGRLRDRNSNRIACRGRAEGEVSGWPARVLPAKTNGTNRPTAAICRANNR